MNRREFLGTSALAGPALLRHHRAGASRPSREARALAAWTWVHGASQADPEAWRAQCARLRGAGLTGILVSGGDTAMLGGIARATGLAFHRWMWILNRSGDARVKSEHPEWFTVSRNGESSLEHPPYVGYYQWLCPTRQAVRDYLREEITAAARDPAVEGIHLDYIRHCDVILPRGLWERYHLVQDHEMAEFDFCYCDACRAAFRAQTGRDPTTLPDPPTDERWRAFRWASVTGLVRELAAAVNGLGKTISAAVFPTPTIARRLVRQAWDEWPLDAVFPMIYHEFYNQPVEWVAPAVREGVRALPNDRALHAGLHVPGLQPYELGQSVRLARAQGAAGVALYDLGAVNDAHLDWLRETLAG